MRAGAQEVLSKHLPGQEEKQEGENRGGEKRGGPWGRRPWLRGGIGTAVVLPSGTESPLSSEVKEARPISLLPGDLCAPSPQREQQFGAPQGPSTPTCVGGALPSDEHCVDRPHVAVCRGVLALMALHRPECAALGSALL